MHSFDYTLAHTRGLRRLLRLWNLWRISSYERKELERMEANPKDLRHFEKKIFSQNGEDGIIEEIFQRIGTTNKYFVEFGVEDGQECNTRYLLEKKSWRGLWMDGSEENCQSARDFFKAYSMDFKKAFIDAENIESLFKTANVPQFPDLLSIDIDGNDYWVWKAITSYQPRVVVMEYNASFPPPTRWVMPYNKNHQFDGTRNFGASLVALSELAREKGYTLVGCDKKGVNAFFVRNDLAVADLFLEKDTNYFYSCPKYISLFFGHPKGKGPWIQKKP
jgi:hypothetical protein